jgi:hypothetical protein
MRGRQGIPEPQSYRPVGEEPQMHPEDVMNADMPSEILLLASGFVIFVTLFLVLVAALTQTAALP